MLHVSLDVAGEPPTASPGMRPQHSRFVWQLGQCVVLNLEWYSVAFYVVSHSECWRRPSNQRQHPKEHLRRKLQ